MYQIFEDVTENEKIYQYYQTLENYKFVSGNGDPNTVLIFFSSNSLYLPTSYEAFHETIVQNNRYEWENLAKDPVFSKAAGSILFVRDIYKNWWLEGLDAQHNTQDKMLALLKQLTADKIILTAGISAGGYAAIWFGAKLNAERIYAFSPQIDLHVYHQHHPIRHYDSYVQANHPGLVITSVLQDYHGDLYYLYPCKCQEDIDQVACLHNDASRIRLMPISRNIHGRTLLPVSMIRFIAMTRKQADTIYRYYQGKEINHYGFLFHSSGFLPGVIYLLKRAIEALVKRFIKK